MGVMQILEEGRNIRMHEKQIEELIRFGIEKHIAEEIVYNNQQIEVEAILNFLTNYRHLIKTK